MDSILDSQKEIIEPDPKRSKMVECGPTRWGIVTAGYISADFAISVKTLSQEEHQIIAVASRSKEKADEFAKRFNISKAYGSYEEMAKDKDIDVMYIGSIPTMQFSLSMMYLKSGYNVVCENPFTMNTNEVRQLVQTAKEHNLFLMEGNQAILCPAHTELMSHLTAGEIGTPRFVSGNAGVNLRDRAETEWPQIQGVSGLLLFSLGRWGIYFAQSVFGHERPKKISATAIYDGKDNEADLVTVTLTYSNNRLATINCCSSLMLDNTVSVFGSGGPSGPSMKLDCMYCPQTISYFMKECKNLPIPKSSDYKTTFPNGESLQFVAKAVRDCLQKGLKEHPLLSLANCILTTEIIDEVRKQIGLVYEADS